MIAQFHNGLPDAGALEGPEQAQSSYFIIIRSLAKSQAFFRTGIGIKFQASFDKVMIVC